ncbi:Membrane associated serine protease, rhomboid family [bacterium A37T11]|nr:Membrane associated serine protease, rhomboid family [bacterium A37T11]
MNRSVISELWQKVFRSGNPINLIIAINVFIFLLINLSDLFVKLFSLQFPLGDFFYYNLAIPANPGILLYKPWTIITYMFSQRDLFHGLFNMLWLFWMGQIFLNFLNKRQFVFVYLAGGLAGAVLFLLFYNFIPAFKNDGSSWLIGASASVNAVVFAAATLVPNYTLRLMFFGDVRLKYMAIALVFLDILLMSGMNAGGSISHLGGALLGFVYIKMLQSGNDMSKLFSKRKPKLKVLRNEEVFYGRIPNQEYIDSLLDKISQSGYHSLSKAEKEALSKASKQDQD